MNWKEILKIIAQVIVAALTALLTSLGMTSCGSTRVNVDRPAAGTSTTITVTTNNPITTEVNPQTNPNINLQ